MKCIGRGVIPKMSTWYKTITAKMTDNFSEKRIEELSRILKITDDYTIRNVPSARVNEILWRLSSSLRSHTVELQPFVNGTESYQLFTSRNGVQHA